MSSILLKGQGGGGALTTAEVVVQDVTGLTEGDKVFYNRRTKGLEKVNILINNNTVFDKTHAGTTGTPSTTAFLFGKYLTYVSIPSQPSLTTSFTLYYKVYNTETGEESTSSFSLSMPRSSYTFNIGAVKQFNETTGAIAVSDGENYFTFPFKISVDEAGTFRLNNKTRQEQPSITINTSYATQGGQYYTAANYSRMELTPNNVLIFVYAPNGTGTSYTTYDNDMIRGSVTTLNVGRSYAYQYKGNGITILNDDKLLLTYEGGVKLFSYDAAGLLTELSSLAISAHGTTGLPGAYKVCNLIENSYTILSMSGSGAAINLHTFDVSVGTDSFSPTTLKETIPIAPALHTVDISDTTILVTPSSDSAGSSIATIDTEDGFDIDVKQAAVYGSSLGSNIKLKLSKGGDKVASVSRTLYSIGSGAAGVALLDTLVGGLGLDKQYNNPVVGKISLITNNVVELNSTGYGTFSESLDETAGSTLTPYTTVLSSEVIYQTLEPTKTPRAVLYKEPSSNVSSVSPISTPGLGVLQLPTTTGIYKIDTTGSYLMAFVTNRGAAIDLAGCVVVDGLVTTNSNSSVIASGSTIETLLAVDSNHNSVLNLDKIGGAELAIYKKEVY